MTSDWYDHQPSSHETRELLETIKNVAQRQDFNAFMPLAERFGQLTGDWSIHNLVTQF
jgi:hypothetical protein